MQNITAINLSKNIFNVLDRAITNHEPFSVSTDKGNAVILNDEDYRVMKEKLLAGMAEPLSECISEEDAGW
ncbi:MAG: type II toxin-antitoxin system Phd/YefM family antitoxin [Synergistaceae bacterium]|nr:type II toxin-antitoxin system Phd/YefM family antitoxin [Synergistaceae bacterium]